MVETDSHFPGQQQAGRDGRQSQQDQDNGAPFMRQQYNDH
jgi:hypothetical protein